MTVEKLKLWGITQAQVDAILKQGKADFKVPIISPIGGHVLKKNIVEGQYVQEGQAMFEIADLHTVWVKAQIYEDEAGKTWVEYDRPSSLFGQFGNAEIAPTAAMLDRKLEALVAAAFE